MLAWDMARPLPSARYTALGFLVLFGILSDAQQQSPQQAEKPRQPSQASSLDSERPVFRTGINFVRVDVIITDAVYTLDPRGLAGSAVEAEQAVSLLEFSAPGDGEDVKELVAFRVTG